MAADDVALQDEQDAVLTKYNLLVPFLTGSSSLAEVARTSNVPLRTLWSWNEKFKRHGLKGLMRQRRSDKNAGKSVSEQTRHIVESLLLKSPKPSVSHVHRQLQSLSAKGLTVPSYSTVRRIAAGIPRQVQVLAYEGAKAYGHTYDLVFRHEASRPNELWQSDHSMLDCYVLNEKGLPCRPWLTIILDDFSRAIAGYYLSLDSPASWKTALAYRQAILRKDDPRWHVFGIPEAFYTDNGSDYTSKRIEMVSADLKVHLIFSTAGEPRGRGKIERFFRTVNELFLCGFPGFAPEGTMPEKKDFLRLDELETQFKEWLISGYMHRIHSELGTTPQSRWEGSQFLPRLPETFDQLDLLLCTVSTQRKVHRDGIRFLGLRYMSTDLAGWVGESLTMRYDPRDMAEVHVYDGDKRITRAICQNLPGAVISLKAIQRARSAERKRVSNILADTNRVWNDFIDMHKGKTDEDEMRSTKTTLKTFICD